MPARGSRGRQIQGMSREGYTCVLALGPPGVAEHGETNQHHHRTDPDVVDALAQAGRSAPSHGPSRGTSTQKTRADGEETHPDHFTIESPPSTLAGAGLSSSNFDMKMPLGVDSGWHRLGDVRHFAEPTRKERSEKSEKVRTEKPDQEVFEENNWGRRSTVLVVGLSCSDHGDRRCRAFGTEQEVQAEQWHEERGKHRDVQREEQLQRNRAETLLSRCIERRAGRRRPERHRLELRRPI